MELLQMKPTAKESGRGEDGDAAVRSLAAPQLALEVKSNSGDCSTRGPERK